MKTILINEPGKVEVIETEMPAVKEEKRCLKFCMAEFAAVIWERIAELLPMQAIREYRGTSSPRRL